MPRIIIIAPSYNSAIGGAVALHKLCSILNDLGYDAYLTTVMQLNGSLEYFVLNDKYNTKIALEMDVDKDIIVYPECIAGNPYGGKNVVRYILSTHHLPSRDNIAVTWDEQDYWLYYHKLFYDDLRDPNYLHVIDSRIDDYKDLGLERTVDACYTYRKRSNERNSLPQVHPSDALEIGYNVQDVELIRIFNTCKRFYTYDTETYLSVLASICGCESVIVPYEGLTKEQIVEGQPSFKYGIAYGLGDLKHANETRSQLREYLRGLEIQQVADTDAAFKKVLTYFNL